MLAFADAARGAGGGLGFTLVEVMVATFLSSLVLAAVLTANLQIVRSGVRITQYAEMSTQVRRGLGLLGQDLRNASNIKWNGASDITLTLPTMSGSTTQMTYAWSAVGQSLFRVPGAASSATAGRETLIRGLPPFADGSAGVAFARYDRSGAAATTDAATKRVQVVLNVKRKAQTMAAASETAISASFVLRNKPVQ